MTEDRGMICIGPYDITIDELLSGNEGEVKEAGYSREFYQRVFRLKQRNYIK